MLGAFTYHSSTHEVVQELLESVEGGKHTVNSVRDSHRDTQQPKGEEPTKQACYRWGNVGHFGRDPACPARGKTCKKFGRADHFAQQCNSKTSKPTKPRHDGKSKNRKKNVRYVQDVEEEDDEYASFIVKSASHPEKVKVFVGGVVVAMVIIQEQVMLLTKTCDQSLSKKTLGVSLRRVKRSFILIVLNSH